MDAPTREHEVKETLTVDIYYPDHPPRVESSLFRHTRHQLLEVEKRGCWVCGVRAQLEVHHFHVEWADAEGVDWVRMRQLHPRFHWQTFKEPADFVDAPYNMMVLCADHHRHRDRGIHMLPYPIWVMQRERRKDFVFAPRAT